MIHASLICLGMTVLVAQAPGRLKDVTSSPETTPTSAASAIT